jgi:hypothetical protein
MRGAVARSHVRPALAPRPAGTVSRRRHDGWYAVVPPERAQVRERPH